jgi:AcrR family transcriptional regulator
LSSSEPSRPSRSAILNVAHRLYAASDYSGVTMREIAKKVGCRSPSLYHYFKSKDEIFRALVDRGITLFEQFLPTIDSTDPLDQLWWRFWRYYEFSKAHPEYFRLLFVDRSSPVGNEMLHARVLSGADTHRCIEACVKGGLLPPGTDAVETAEVLCCAVHGAAVMGMRRRCTELARDLLAERTLGLAIDGLRASLIQSPSRSLFVSQTHRTDGAAANDGSQERRRA